MKFSKYSIKKINTAQLKIPTYLGFGSIVADASTAASHIFHCHIQGVHRSGHCVVKHQHRRNDAHSMNITLHFCCPFATKLLVLIQ